MEWTIWPLRPNGFPGDPQPESARRVIERYSLDTFITSCRYDSDTNCVFRQRFNLKRHKMFRGDINTVCSCWGSCLNGGAGWSDSCGVGGGRWNGCYRRGGGYGVNSAEAFSGLARVRFETNHHATAARHHWSWDLVSTEMTYSNWDVCLLADKWPRRCSPDVTEALWMWEMSALTLLDATVWGAIIDVHEITARLWDEVEGCER